MSTLNVIGEFFHNRESGVSFAAARDLTEALAQTAPRGCSSNLLIAKDTIAPAVHEAKASVEKMFLHSAMLPVLWHSNQAARPLDGQYLHAFTPLAPLRTREEDDGSQSSVMITHSLAWDAPESLPKGQAKQFRSFTRRALKHADVIVTPTHAIAQRLREIYGQAVSPIVLPLAAPAEYLAGADATERRAELQIPEQYLLTNASASKIGQLDWLLRAYEADTSLPHLVVIDETGEFDKAQWPALAERVTSLNPAKLSDIGALIAGAKALVLPQRIGDCLYPVYGALAQGVPVVHAGSPCIREISLDAGVGPAGQTGVAEQATLTPEAAAETEQEFAEILSATVGDEAELERLSVLARDRSRSFSWRQTAWQLWEIHANI